MKTKYLIAGVAAAVAAGLDQWSKSAILERFELHEAYRVGEYFNIVHVRNAGAAFGLLNAQPPSVTVPLFLLLGLVALGVVYYYLRTTPDRLRIMPLALGCILGGAVGNIIDRIRFGNVVDFLDFHLGRYHWPSFNVADMAIVIGVGLLAIELLWRNADAFEPATPST